MNLISENTFNSHCFYGEFFFKDYDSSSVLLFMVLKYLLLSSNDSSVYIKHQYHHHWQQHAFLTSDTLKQFWLLLYNHLQHTGNHFGINDPAIKRVLLLWLSKKSSWDLTHFSSHVKVMSDKTLPLLFACCIAFVEGPLPQQSNTT